MGWNSRRTILVILIVFIAVAAFAYFYRDNSQEIVVGAISPFSGDGAQYGETARTGIDLAVSEINAAGGVQKKKLSIQYEDDRGDATAAVSAFNKLTSVDKVSAVLGPFYSGNVLAAAAVANRTMTPMISGSATSDNIRLAGPYVFRVCPSNDEQARTIANYARTVLKLKTAFILYRNADYGVTLRSAFEKAFPAAGGTIVGAEAVKPDTSDVRAQLAKVKAANPDMIFAAVHFPEGGALLRQSKEIGVTATVIGTDGGQDPELIKIAGDAAEGSYWATIGWGSQHTNSEVAKFKAAYHAKYGADPGVYSALYYDATKVLAEALSHAKSMSGPDILVALHQVNYVGPTGQTVFDANGDVSKPFAVFEVKKGQFVPVP